MEEKLISYRTGELAKEKGFNIRTDFKFDRNNKIDRTPSLKYQLKHGTNILIKPYEFTFAPTQSFLQKWLREVHNMEMYIIYPDGFWKYMARTNYSLTTIKNGGIGYNTYEEALEEALYEGLKNI